MCVCVFSSHSFWTSSSLDVPAGVTQEEGHTGFLIHLLSAVRALIFLARRIQQFISLVDREVEFFVLNDLIVLHPLGIFILGKKWVPDVPDNRVHPGQECFMSRIGLGQFEGTCPKSGYSSEKK